jgi:hypothetical protein
MTATTKRRKKKQPKDKPLFTLIGKVDGISYQLDTSSEDAADWKEVKVIIEMKNRVNRISKEPKIHDHIQVVSYMKMMNCSFADLVQIKVQVQQPEQQMLVVSKHDEKEKENACQNYRPSKSQSVIIDLTDEGNDENEPKQKSDCTNNISRASSAELSEATSRSNSFSARIERSTVLRMNSSEVLAKRTDAVLHENIISKTTTIASTSSTTSSNRCSPVTNPISNTVPVDIEAAKKLSLDGDNFQITRIALNGPPYHHAQHWDTVIIPRLIVFRDAIMLVRKDDALRRQFLMSEPEQQLALIRQLCPYLV